MVNLAESHAPPQPDVQSDVAVARRLRHWWPDALIAVVLGLTAFLYRRHFPTDGFFYDDGWQAVGAIKGSFSQVLTVGQPSPGFGLELMVWVRIFGDSAVSVITPALIAGAIGPPALYLVLRRFGVARSIAALMGAALAVCAAPHDLFAR